MIPLLAPVLAVMGDDMIVNGIAFDSLGVSLTAVGGISCWNR